MTKRKIRTARSGAGAEATASGAPCKTLSVPEAGALYYVLGRHGSYEAAKRGLIPTIEILGKLRVPIILMERQLEEAGQGRTSTSAAADAAP